MESLIEVFHLDVKLLIAQAVNFAIVFGVIYYFALKPLLAVMQKRTATIEKSLSDAKKIDEKLKLAEEERAKAIQEAKKEAAGIMEKANLDAEEHRTAMIVRAKEEIGEVINREKEKMQMEKAAVLKEIKSDVSSLVISALEKIFEKKLDSKEDKDLIRKFLK